jgi:hypothetical protein
VKLTFCPRCRTKITQAQLQRYFSNRCRAERLSPDEQETCKIIVSRLVEQPKKQF